MLPGRSTAALPCSAAPAGKTHSERATQVVTTAKLLNALQRFIGRVSTPTTIIAAFVLNITSLLFVIALGHLGRSGLAVACSYGPIDGRRNMCASSLAHRQCGVLLILDQYRRTGSCISRCGRSANNVIDTNTYWPAPVKFPPGGVKLQRTFAHGKSVVVPRRRLRYCRCEHT